MSSCQGKSCLLAAKRLVGARRIVGLVGLAVLAAVVLVFCYYRVTMRRSGQIAVTYVDSHGIGSQIVNDIKQGRYDDAVQIAQQSLRNRPSDTFIDQEIATVYLIRAQKEDPSRRDQWVAKAVSYADKTLSIYSKSEDNAGVQLFEIARTFEIAGDLSATERCARYERAAKLLEDRVPLLQGDHLTLQGRTFPLDRVRKENERVLAEMKGKFAKAGCK